MCFPPFCYIMSRERRPRRSAAAKILEANILKALVFGEVLWDVFPGGRKLGGAPMNFCAHVARLGAEGYMLTAVGRDKLGDIILEAMETHGIKKDFVKINEQKPTGVCNVTLNSQGQPSYELVEDVAYDNITVTDADTAAMEAHEFDVLYFGSLAQRNSVSADTLKKVIDNCSFKEVFCDINIRQDYYSRELIEASFAKSTVIKINRDEFELVKKLELVNSGCTELHDVCRQLCDKYNLKVVIVTLDSDGAAAYSHAENKLYTSSRQEATLVSAVGAGDSFSACFMYNYISGNDIQTCIDRANILGAYVVSFEEAIPEYSRELIEKIK